MYRTGLLSLALLGVSLLATAQKGKLNTGYIALSQNKFSDAITNLEAGLVNTEGYKDKDFAKAYAKLGVAYVGVLETGDLFKKQFPDAALRAYKAFEKVPQYDPQNTYKAEIDGKAGVLGNSLAQQAYEFYKSAREIIDANPTGVPQAQKPRLDSLFRVAGEFLTGAETTFKRVGVTVYGIYALRGFVNLERADTAAVIKDFEQTIAAYDPTKLEEEDKQIPYLHRLLVIFYDQYEKNPQKALDFAKVALEKFPEDNELRDAQMSVILNRVAAEPAYLDEALTRFKAETERSPGDVLILVNYGVLLDRKDPVAAAEVYRSVLKLDPGNYAANRNLGKFYLDRGDVIAKDGEAIRENMSITNRNARIDDYNKRVLANNEKLLAELKLALPYLERAYQTDDKDYELLQALVTICTQLNLIDKANEYKRIKDAR